MVSNGHARAPFPRNRLWSDAVGVIEIYTRVRYWDKSRTLRGTARDASNSPSQSKKTFATEGKFKPRVLRPR